MPQNMVSRFAMSIFLSCTLMAMISGCAKSEYDDSLEVPTLSPVTTVVESYGDIELPVDMLLVPEKSMAMRTDSFQGGIHVFKGRVDIASLKDYVIASMNNHKWKLVGEASTKEVMLAFTKPNKTCMVVLASDSLGRLGKTIASFYVTVDVAASSRLNPFGEPVTQ